METFFFFYIPQWLWNIYFRFPTYTPNFANFGQTAGVKCVAFTGGGNWYCKRGRGWGIDGGIRLRTREKAALSNKSTAWGGGFVFSCNLYIWREMCLDNVSVRQSPAQFLLNHPTLPPATYNLTKVVSKLTLMKIQTYRQPER